MANASSKQLRYVHGMIGKLIDNKHFTSRADMWESLGLLEDTLLKDLTGKQASELIGTLKPISEQYE